MWYSRRMPRRIPGAVIVAVAATLLMSAYAGAQMRRPAQPDPDMAELSAYRLNTATLQKAAVAMDTFMAALESDPKYKSYMAAEKELKALERKADRTEADERRIAALEQQLEKPPAGMNAGDAATLTEMERAIAAMPHMSESLANAGLSPR